MMSSACPVECSEPLSPDRNPPYDVMSGNFAQIARCTRIASGVSPSSTAEPDLQTAREIKPDVVVVAVLATGLVGDRYCALTQRDLPALTTSAQRPSTLPETETLVPFGSTSSRTPVSGTDQRFTSVVVYFVPVIFGGMALALSAARVFAAVGFGIGACFFRCFAVGLAVGFGFGAVGVAVGTLIGGRKASRLIVVSRANCRDELAIDGSSLTCWLGSAAAEPVATSATAAPGIATLARPGWITLGRGCRGRACVCRPSATSSTQSAETKPLSTGGVKHTSPDRFESTLSLNALRTSTGTPQRRPARSSDVTALKSTAGQGRAAVIALSWERSALLPGHSG